MDRTRAVAVRSNAVLAALKATGAAVWPHASGATKSSAAAATSAAPRRGIFNMEPLFPISAVPAGSGRYGQACLTACCRLLGKGVINFYANLARFLCRALFLGDFRPFCMRKWQAGLGVMG